MCHYLVISESNGPSIHLLDKLAADFFRDAICNLEANAEALRFACRRSFGIPDAVEVHKLTFKEALYASLALSEGRDDTGGGLGARLVPESPVMPPNGGLAVAQETACHV